MVDHTFLNKNEKWLVYDHCEELFSDHLEKLRKENKRTAETKQVNKQKHKTNEQSTLTK